MKGTILAALLLAATACVADVPDTASDATWVGSITTEGNTTTVINESGSVWDGQARLVEEMSIGVESGPDEYMLGRVTGLYATDEEIFVVDEQVPVVRVFDRDGRHLRDIGGAGQGPGEFERPQFITGAPDGRIFVLGMRPQRINVFGPGPDDVDAWPLGMSQCCLHAMAMAPDGTLWIEGAMVDRETRRYQEAIRAHGPEGPADEQFPIPTFDYEHWTLRFNGRDIESVPYAPSIVWTIHPDGPLVAGASDQYRIEILSPAGSRTVVERYWDPVAVSDQERTYARRNTNERYSRNETGQDAGLQWDERIPATKPAFLRILPSHTGGFWVLREGPAKPIEDCDPEERVEVPRLRTTMLRRCFRAPTIIDAFDADGLYLGEIDGPPPHPTYTFIRGDMVLMPGQDAAGTVVVRRYRLVLPGEAGQ